MKNRFMHLSLVLPLLLGFESALALAQERPAIRAQPNTVYVGADGKFEAVPDTALVQFNISAQEESSKAAYERATRAADQIREILRSSQIDPKAAEIGFFSIQPIYDYRNPKRKLVAYRVNSSVSLKLKDFSKIAPIVQQLAETDVTENESVSYTLENIDAAKIKAVEDAFRHARGEAAAVAVAGGRSLGELSYSSVDTLEQVRVLQGMRSAVPMATGRMAEMNAAPIAEFSPQKIVITAHVNALFNLK